MRLYLFVGCLALLLVYAIVLSVTLSSDVTSYNRPWLAYSEPQTMSTVKQSTDHQCKQAGGRNCVPRIASLSQPSKPTPLGKTRTSANVENDLNDQGAVVTDRILVGNSSHGYGLAYSPARHVFEGEDGDLYVFFYDGKYIQGRVIANGEVVGPLIQVSHAQIPGAGFSVVQGDGFFLVAYADPTSNAVISPTLYVRRVYLSDGVWVLRDPSPVSIAVSSMEFQAPCIAIAPDGLPWIVFRSDRGGGSGFPVSVVRAKNILGTSWDDPVEVSSFGQISTSAAGTSGAIYWPGGETVVIQGGSRILHASINTESVWQPYVVDDEYTGIHGFSGVVIGDTLYLAYIATTEIRLITYIAGIGWSNHVYIAEGSSHSVSLSNVDGVPTVFGYDPSPLEGTDGLFWYRTLKMNERIPVSVVHRDNILYAWTASPEKGSRVIIAWVEGKTTPWNVYLAYRDPN